MHASDADTSGVPGDEPSLAESLQTLRRDAGGVTYAEIAARISRLRAERTGTPQFEVSRSTVYDAFRPTRTRLNPDLIADIVVSLGVSVDDAEQWRQHCITARPAAPRRPVHAAPPDLAVPPEEGVGPGNTEQWSRRKRIMLLTVLIAAATAVNILGGQLVLWFELPLYLDMTGTAVVAIAAGPWYAVATAIITQLTGAAIHQNAAGLPYTPVAIAGALVWGFGVHKWRLARSSSRFLLLSLLVAAVCTLVAVPITAVVFGGYSEHIAANTLTERFQSIGESLLLSLASANFLTSVLDKLIASFIGLTIGVALLTNYSQLSGRRSGDAPLLAPWLIVSRPQGSGRQSAGLALRGAKREWERVPALWGAGPRRG